MLLRDGSELSEKTDFDSLFLFSTDVVFALLLRDGCFLREKTDFEEEFLFFSDGAVPSLPWSELSEKTDREHICRLLSGDSARVLTVPEVVFPITEVEDVSDGFRSKSPDFLNIPPSERVRCRDLGGSSFVSLGGFAIPRMTNGSTSLDAPFVDFLDELCLLATTGNVAITDSPGSLSMDRPLRSRPKRLFFFGVSSRFLFCTLVFFSVVFPLLFSCLDFRPKPRWVRLDWRGAGTSFRLDWRAAGAAFSAFRWAST